MLPKIFKPCQPGFVSLKHPCTTFWLYLWSCPSVSFLKGTSTLLFFLSVFSLVLLSLNYTTGGVNPTSFWSTFTPILFSTFVICFKLFVFFNRSHTSRISTAVTRLLCVREWEMIFFHNSHIFPIIVLSGFIDFSWVTLNVRECWVFKKKWTNKYLFTEHKINCSMSDMQ